MACVAVPCQRSVPRADLAKPHTFSKNLLPWPYPTVLPSFTHCSRISRACKNHIFLLLPLKSLLGGGTALVHWAEVGGTHRVVPLIPQALVRKLNQPGSRRSQWPYSWWAVGAARSQSRAGALYTALQVLLHAQQAQVKAEFCLTLKQ